MRVSILLARALFDAVERVGVARAQLCDASGLPPELLDDASVWLTLRDYERLQRAALELSGDPALGLHLGEQSASHVFDVLGHLTMHAETLRDGIETILRYSRLIAVEPVATLHEEREIASVRFGLPRGDALGVRFASELALGGLTRMLRTYVGSDALPLAVSFGYSAPPYRAEYTRIFGGRERFDQPFTGLDLPRAWLAHRQLHTSPELFSVLKTQAERALGRLTREDTVAERVLRHLAAADPKQAPAMDGVARELGMSARSLRRKLAAESVEYKQLLEHVRMLAAQRMLEDPAKSIQETAFALGFATPSAFHRAFKRWTGKTPKAYKATF